MKKKIKELPKAFGGIPMKVMILQKVDYLQISDKNKGASIMIPTGRAVVFDQKTGRAYKDALSGQISGSMRKRFWLD